MTTINNTTIPEDVMNAARYIACSAEQYARHGIKGLCDCDDFDDYDDCDDDCVADAYTPSCGAYSDAASGCLYDHRYNIAEDVINRLVKYGHDASKLNMLCDSIAALVYREAGCAFDDITLEAWQESRVHLGDSVVYSIAESLQKIIM